MKNKTRTLAEINKELDKMLACDECQFETGHSLSCSEFTEPKNSMEWETIFAKFHDKNELGGSSRFLVAPNTVKNFIAMLIRESQKEVLREIQRETSGGGDWRKWIIQKIDKL